MSDTKAPHEVVAEALANWGNGEAQDAFDVLMGRLDIAEGRLESLLRTSVNTTSIVSAENLKRAQRAEADNAALLRALHSAYRPHAGECIRFGATGQQVRPCPCGVDALLDSEHPGAALLEELEGLRKQVDSLKESVELLRTDRDTAHNAALEEAAKRVTSALEENYKDATAREVASIILALKKTGQGE